ncbi:Hcp family type VI secretion system effector [Albidovulum sediminicola]|uniref:Type VI secretion system tube protein Hcp n=1 Tax=Albidovulum sediminicola TaxID=2984331 RepID=A0ABT2Z025_9RHOB|nr:type VI secretion system tube protein Hcp [Defluviimonas sp. WL0075]MCV2864503.1 type VI secretion system tube protein Hcp [Defluviimonas sp. WL0075]
MSFDAFCYSTTNAEDIPGETQDETYADKKAFEIISFELGAENNINIGSISGGGGAGKATFKEVSITKKTDTASTGLFHALVTGKHFDNMFIELRRSGAEDTKSGGKFMVFELQMVMVQDISWSGSDGDDVCEETVVLQYGAIKIHYYPQDTKGKMAGQPKEAYWNRVKNNKSMIY